MSMKRCPTCGEMLALEAFPPNPNGADGHHATCPACIERRRSATKKVCNRCGDMKPLADFPTNSASFDGRRNTCRACLQQGTAQRRKATSRQRQQEWRATHLLGGCLKSLRDEVDLDLALENVTRPGVKAPLLAVLDLFTRTDPAKLNLRAELVYEAFYYDALYEGFRLPPGSGIATIYLTGPKGRKPAYHVFVAASDDAAASKQAGEART